MAFFKLNDNTQVEIILPRHQAERLTGTCFRGPQCRQAGNFFRWRFFADFIKDPMVRQCLLSKLQKLVEEANVNKNHRIELKFDADIGWDSVMDINELKPCEMIGEEERQLNRRATAVFLPVGNILAPKTNFVTLVIQQRHVGHWQFKIQTIYPGPDVGQLQGNMTERFGLVWLGWDNPGE